ncbi:hypothetical protein GC176_12640 [bacterium]|nr:hypothetical protein [bacterium]
MLLPVLSLSRESAKWWPEALGLYHFDPIIQTAGIPLSEQQWMVTCFVHDGIEPQIGGGRRVWQRFSTHSIMLL